MRFSVAMDSLEKEIRILRAVVIALLILSIALCVGILHTSQKNPLVIERGCLSKILPISAGEFSKEEIQSFLELALNQRFNTKFTGNELLSNELQIAREQEQKELLRLNMKQLVILNAVDFNDKKMIAQADRLISTADVRSAFKWPLEVEFLSVPRSETNPYGLILTSVRPVENKNMKEVQSK